MHKAIPDAVMVFLLPPSAQELARRLRGRGDSSEDQVKVRLEPFVGQWLPVPAPERTCLGRSGAALGEGAFLGERLWEQQTKLRLHLGPLSGPAFRAFLPGRPASTELGRLVELHLGQLLACDLALDLLPEAVPPARLTQGEAAPRLGLNLWLRTRPDPPPPDPVVFRIQA